MLGAIIGDVVGSVYEFDNTKDYNFHLLTPRSEFTDDTVMTLAVAQWLSEEETHSHEYLVRCMRELGLKYPWAGYGGNFKQWLIEWEPKPYNSWGNGSGMRVSPVSFYARSLDEALDLAKISAEVTHNHPEGIKGAQAIAAAVFLTRQGKTKEELREYLEATFDYDLHRTIDEIRPDYTYDVSCMGSVPEAIIAYLDSHDFESAIRNSVSIGGDSDTIGAMTGAIAQAAYDMPKAIAGYCYGLLTPTLRHMLDNFERKIGKTTDDPFNLQRFTDMQQTDFARDERRTEAKPLDMVHLSSTARARLQLLLMDIRSCRYRGGQSLSRPFRSRSTSERGDTGCTDTSGQGYCLHHGLLHRCPKVVFVDDPLRCGLSQRYLPPRARCVL